MRMEEMEMEMMRWREQYGYNYEEYRGEYGGEYREEYDDEYEEGYEEEREEAAYGEAAYGEETAYDCRYDPELTDYMQEEMATEHAFFRQTLAGF